MSLRDIKNEIKYFIQRGRRGYSDRDNWDIPCYLAEILPPMVRHLKNTGTGAPFNLIKNDSRENWEDILEEIAQGFEAYDSARDKNLLDCPEEMEKYHRGMELFVKYFGYLWN